MSYSAVLFDLDGTLVDSIALWMKAYRETLGSWGLEMSEKEFLDTVYSKNAHFRDVLARFGREDDAGVFRIERDALYTGMLRKEVEWIAGAKEVLDALRPHHRLGMVTGSFQSYVDAIDSCLGISSYFEHTVTCDETAGRSKPQPYPLQLAAEKMGVPVSSCLYVGDQQFDVDAAKAAGMTMCLIPEKYTPDDAHTDVDLVLQSISDLPTLL